MIPYAWTIDDDEVAFDAMTVGIGDDGPALLFTRLTLSEISANVYWPDRIDGGDKIHDALEGPYSVPQALKRADILCALWDYKRVVITLQHRETWRPDWGELREWEGLDA